MHYVFPKIPTMDKIFQGIIVMIIRCTCSAITVPTRLKKSNKFVRSTKDLLTYRCIVFGSREHCQT